MLSSVIVGNEIFVNDKGYAWMKIKETNKTIVRKVYSKPFSNFSIDTVRIKNQMYQVDSKVTITATAGKPALEYVY